MSKKIKYHKVILKNGLTVVNISGFSTKATTISAYIRAGCRFDPKNRPGLSHFVEHMAFNGTKSYPSPQKVAQAIEQFGGWHDAFTWVEHQKHTVRLPVSEFETGLKLLLETIFYPLVKRVEVEKEKGIIKEEILRNKADPQRAAWDYAWFPLFFQGTDLARPYSGTQENVQGITELDVKMFMSSYYVPSRIVLFVAGDLNTKYVNEKTEKYTYRIHNGRKSELSIRNLVPKVKKNTLLYSDKSYYQTSLTIGVKTVPFSSSIKPIYDILHEMLVGYFGTPLIQELRDKGGLIYTWNSFHDNLSDIGYLAINLSAAHENINKVISIVLKEFKRFAKGKFSKREVEMAKNHLIGKTLTNIETGLNYVDWYGLQELLNPSNVLDIQQTLNIYRNINMDQISDVAKKSFLNNNVFIGAIGPEDQFSLSNL